LLAQQNWLAGRGDRRCTTCRRFLRSHAREDGDEAERECEYAGEAAPGPGASVDEAHWFFPPVKRTAIAGVRFSIRRRTHP
jgi:hypothetical protein